MTTTASPTTVPPAVTAGRRDAVTHDDRWRHDPIDLERARLLVDGHVTARAARTLGLDAALGCVLAEDVRAPQAVPSFDNSAMDGYAVRCATLVPHGKTRHRLRIDAAVPICTGQPIPVGMDAIVPVERIRISGRFLLIAGPVRPGDHIRPAGEEFAAGDVALRAGLPLSPSALGLLSLLGYARVRVVPRPRVAILVTGDEIVAPGAPLGSGQVHDANGPLLRALVADSGGRVVSCERLPDDRARIEDAIRRLTLDSDLLCTSGGASVGARDHLFAALAACGQVVVRELAIKPGRPTTFALVAGKPVVSLPGNPFALQSGFEALARPALLQLAGRSDRERESLAMRAAVTIAHQRGRLEYLPVHVAATADVPHASPIERRGSAMLSGIASSGFVAILPASRGDIAAGESVDVQRWGPAGIPCQQLGAGVSPQRSAAPGGAETLLGEGPRSAAGWPREPPGSCRTRAQTPST